MQHGERIVIEGREYRLGSVLSTRAGSYGQVWDAVDPSGRTVALKFINTEAMSQADRSLHGHWRAHLEREIHFLGGLSAAQSRHIVTLLAHGQIDGQPVLVLEKMQANLGHWLEQARRNGDPPPDLCCILDWVDQILMGLDVIHQAGFVYRDLKFSNILVSDQGALLKLADFGSLKREDGDSTRSFIGTPATMAPEQLLPIRQNPDGCEYAVDYRADYYALGLLLFTLLTEQPTTAAQRRLGQILTLYGQEGAAKYHDQLGGINDAEKHLLRQSIESWTVPARTESIPGVAWLLTDLIERLLARDPAARPASSAAIRATLDAVRVTQPVMTTIAPDDFAIPPDVPPNRHPRRSRTSVVRRSRIPARTAALIGLSGLAAALAWTFIFPTTPVISTNTTASIPPVKEAVSPAISVSTPSSNAAAAALAERRITASANVTPPAAESAEPVESVEPTSSEDTLESASVDTAEVESAQPLTAPSEKATIDAATASADNNASATIANTTEETPTQISPPTIVPAPVVAESPPPASAPQVEAEVTVLPATTREVIERSPTTVRKKAISPPKTGPASALTEKTLSPPKTARKMADKSSNKPVFTKTGPIEKKARVVTPPAVPVFAETPPAALVPPKKAPTAKSVSKPRSNVTPTVANTAPKINAVPTITNTVSVPDRTKNTAKSRRDKTAPPPSDRAPTTSNPVALRTPTTPRDQATASSSLPPIDLVAKPRRTASKTTLSQPPIELVSRSMSAAATKPPQPPIQLVGRSLSSSAATPPGSALPTLPSTTGPTSQNPRRMPPKGPQRGSNRSTPDLHQEAKNVGNWVGRTSASVGTEIQRGIETVSQALNDLTGNCQRANGCGAQTVIRRDQWSRSSRRSPP